MLYEQRGIFMSEITEIIAEKKAADSEYKPTKSDIFEHMATRFLASMVPGGNIPVDVAEDFEEFITEMSNYFEDLVVAVPDRAKSFRPSVLKTFGDNRRFDVSFIS
jgi:hypothetical protein